MICFLCEGVSLGTVPVRSQMIECSVRAGSADRGDRHKFFCKATAVRLYWRIPVELSVEGKLTDLDDLAVQSSLLQSVSTTYALTIPQLPDPLSVVVGNAYLLCRIADTIEDEPALDLEAKKERLQEFVDAVAGRRNIKEFSRNMLDSLSDATSRQEQELIRMAYRVLRVNEGFEPEQRRSIEHCIRIMSEGMLEFQRAASPSGLEDMTQLERYCYFVAGVVAEMLADLFCHHVPELKAQQAELRLLSVSYGQGLQMANILNDIWKDLGNGACWLPRDVFIRAGFDLNELSLNPGPGFAKGLQEYMQLTHQQLAAGLRFILMIPKAEQSIRRHLLWTLGLATLTLCNLRHSGASSHRQSGGPTEAKIHMMMRSVNTAAGSDMALKILFAVLTRHFEPFRSQIRSMLRW